MTYPSSCHDVLADRITHERSSNAGPQPTPHRAPRCAEMHNKRRAAFIPPRRPTARRTGSPWNGLLKICLLLAIVTIPPNLWAQAPPSEIPPPEMPPTETPPAGAVFRDAQPVTAIDVLVTLERDGLKEWAAGSAVPQQLTAQDFVITVDGAPVDVVAAAPPDEGLWHLVVYVDAPLAVPETVHWASTLLSQHLDDLLALGMVEIVVADPSPRRLLRPTQDRDEVARVLSQLALEPVGDAELQTLRDAFLQQRTADFPEMSPGELVPLLVEEERRQVRRRHDTLMLWLAERLADRRADDAPSETVSMDSMAPDRRALLYISDGFDADPQGFYGQFLDSGDSESAGSDSADNITTLPTENSDTSDPSLPLHQTLASYGWVAVPMLPPQPKLLKQGLRLGKFLIRPVGMHMQETEPKESARADQPGLRGLFQRLNQIFLGGFHATYEEHRDPDKAEAYLELALALHGQDKLEEATEAYEKALFHFSGDPRTADRQAVALAGIGDLMAELGEGLGAQRAYQKALSLDPELAEDVGQGIAFQDPAAIYATWADVTVGQVVRRGQDLRRFVDAAATRMRLTFQLGAAPSGRLLNLDVQTPERPDRWRHPTWSRSGTPEVISAARLRLALDTPGDLWLPEDDVLQFPGAEPPPIVTLQQDALGDPRVHLRHPAALPGQTAWPDDPPPAIPTRLTLAGVSESSPEIQVVHREVLLDRPLVVVDGDEALPRESLAWGLLVEDLATGSRRLRVVDRP